MSSKVISFLTVIVFISSAKAGFRDDMAQFLTPWIDAAASAKPLLDLVLDEIYFLQKDIFGIEPTVLNAIFQNTEQKLISMEEKTESEQSKACVQGFRNVLKMASEKYKTDGYCFQIQQKKAEEIVVPLIEAIFPVAPTPACPVPILCQLDLMNFSVRKMRDSVGVLKQLHSLVIGLMKFIVYYKAEIISCRKDSSDYKDLTSGILKLAPVCNNL